MNADGDFDLDAYFERIGYTDSPGPTLETLQRLHVLHTEHIAFENLSPWLGEPVKLDIASLSDKLIRSRRGGYCFEQNLLFAHVLAAIGFRTTGLGARVRWNVPDHVMTAHTHMLLLVTLPSGDHIADVGFGGMTPTAPLRLESDIEQVTPHEPFTLRRDGESYTLQTKVGAQWKSLYVFDLREHHRVDYEVTSWYLSNHPQSHFVTGLVAARPEPGRRHALRNNSYSVHELNCGTHTQVLTDAPAMRHLLADTFGIRLPEGNRLDDKLRSLVAS
jgi:N-hydroxyarylamine O-acetyltransferase